MTQGDKVTRWFYEQAESRRLTGTAQRLWHVLYHLLGTAHANRFYAVSSRQLAARMGVCLKSVERGRKALQMAGFLHYEVRGRQVYYKLLLPDALLCGADNQQTDMQNSVQYTMQTDMQSSPQTMYPITDQAEADQTVRMLLAQMAQLEAQMAQYAQLITELRRQLAGIHTASQPVVASPATDGSSVIADEAVLASEFAISEPASKVERENKTEIETFCHDRQQGAVFVADTAGQQPRLLGIGGHTMQDKVYCRILQSRQFLESEQLQSLPMQPAVVHNTDDGLTYRHDQEKRQRFPDVLFNNRYEILLQEYLDKYRDGRFAEACLNHFEMLKEKYKSNGKKRLTEFGFYSIMENLEALTGSDMALKLAVMERSLRNSWVGFFPLPDNTPEYADMEQKQRGRKRSSYRRQYDNDRAYSANGKSHPRHKFKQEGRDLSFLEK